MVSKIHIEQSAKEVESQSESHELITSEISTHCL